MNPTYTNKARRWMLVDDNGETLAMLAALAQGFTDTVIECHNCPKAALAAFVVAPADYELVITDFEMPGMDGVEFCRRLQSVSVVQKVFLATGSGYFSEAAARNYGFSALLAKPFRLVSLAEALAAIGLANENARAL